MTSDPSDLSAKRTFTTGEAAKICNVSQQTIIRCFDSGRLRGYRMEGSGFRRIPRDSLVRFMRSNSIPMAGLERRKRCVLVVDDDEQVLEMLIDLLGRDRRLEVLSAKTGYEAGLLTEKFKPDLMILDYGLPDVNGRVVCRTVRQNPSVSAMKVIIISGGANRHEVAGLLKAGADTFLRKPFVVEHLMERIRGLLDI